MGNRKVKRVAVTGAAGQIAYSLIFRIAQGDLLGKEQPIALHLLDVPEGSQALRGTVMEIEDCCFPLLREIKYGSDPNEVFGDVDYAILIGAKPRGPGMERKDLLLDNGKIFVTQGKALNRVAAKGVRVLVVGNPCNTNCLIAMHHAPDIPFSHFHAMTRLDQNRAVFQLAAKSKMNVQEISRMTIWGNHSSTQVPDFVNARIQGVPVTEVIKDSLWLEKEFIGIIQKRGAEVIATRGKSSAASAAQGILDSLASLLHPTGTGDWFSAAVHSDKNPYGIQNDLVFSFPCQSSGRGDFEIVSGLKITPFLEEKLRITEKELLEERAMVAHLLKG